MMQNILSTLNNGYSYAISYSLSVINAVLLCFIAYRSLQTLQLRGYKGERYMHWLKYTHGRYFSRLFMLCFMSGSALLVINILFSSFSAEIAYIPLLIYFAYLIIFIKNDFKHKKKTPLVFTNRIKRLIAVLAILCAVLSYFLFWLSFYLQNSIIGNLKFVYVCFTPLITPILVLVAFIIMLPFENYHNHSFIKKSRTKLEQMPKLIKIGITGSFGKTSVKNILTTMLSQKYNVLTTPSSYNTPLGLTKIILKQLSREHEIFIAEMGARYKGDIKFICNFVKPQYGIISAISNQHMETFKTQRNLSDTKYELIECLPEDGYAVFNGDSSGAHELFERCRNDKISTSKNSTDGFIRCENVKISNLIEFDLVIGEERRRAFCRLHGSHTISNLLVCVAISHKLGVDIDQIVSAIAELKPVPHRLEVKNYNGLTIIDDSFNANSEGLVAALEVLKHFDGNKKIIITPGLVELGAIQESENFEFGKKIADVADIVLLIGENQTAPIHRGLLEKGYNSEKIHVFNSLEDAKKFLPQIVSIGDVVLFENDLPDNYTE